MKLYEMLQTGLGSTEIYQSLISQEQAVNVLLAGNYSLLPIYAPSDPNSEIRKGMLRKIMARYYNYDLFTEDSLYFGSRLYWRLNQIMPTYAAKFNAVVSAGEFDAVFNDGVTETTTRNRTGNSQSSETSIGSGSTTSKSSGQSDTVSNSSTISKTDSEVFNSDYPQVVVGGATDYNSQASKNIGSATSTGDGTTNVTNNGTNESTNNNTSKSESNGSSTDKAEETRTRQLSPDEVMLAKQKIMNLIINIDEEIVQAVSDMFQNIWDPYEDDCDKKRKQKIEQACKEILSFAIKLNKLNVRINQLNFTEEEIEYIAQVPNLNNSISTLKTEAERLQEDIDNLATVLLPEVTAEDFNKILMVTETGAWDAVRLPNWAEEGF